jgi:hypothetical protein
MSKGFVVLAKNTADTDYVKQAYVLALSILATQTETAISIVTNRITSSLINHPFCQSNHIIRIKI